jgi:uncharacterized membrane protein YfcA
MTQYIIICLVALFASGLTFFSGFGLGTILVPVFAVYFPIEIAIALTAIVHFLNNAFKFVLIGSHVQKQIVLRFGLPAIVAALAGAAVLHLLADAPSLYTYQIGGQDKMITSVKLIIAVLLIIFSVIELSPKLSNITFDKKYLPLGGLLSGFFGGLSGNQGALRSAFLSRAGLTKEQFIASGTAIAIIIDISRLTVYSSDFIKPGITLDYKLIACASLSAFIGAIIGNNALKKITVKTLQTVVGIMLLIFAIFLGLGLI